VGIEDLEIGNWMFFITMSWNYGRVFRISCTYILTITFTIEIDHLDFRHLQEMLHGARHSIFSNCWRVEDI